MCGIFSTINLHVSEAANALTLGRLQHRGPDSGGCWTTSEPLPVWLGHRRLSIVDLSEAGQQPMHNEDRTIWMVCNG
jgi:asparagine synthase (glutamine-hydrolysing)